MALPANVLCYSVETTVGSENAKFDQQKGNGGLEEGRLASQPWLQGIELRCSGKHKWRQRARPELVVAMVGAKAVEFSAN